MVANKVRSSADTEAITEFCVRHELALAGAVPWSDEVGAADRARTATIDWPAAEPVAAAISALRLGIPAATSDLEGAICASASRP
ncbi:MAG: hypothetical protein M3381_06615 [Actinomycetota bacterium]|nr:hypothetical protein [Actinomycetota bacterium]